MIRLIREDGIEILLNTKAIQKVESDQQRRAVITLSNGEVLRVKNPVYDVTQKSKAYLKGLREERKEYNKKMGIEPSEPEKPEKERRKKRGERRYDRRGRPGRRSNDRDYDRDYERDDDRDEERDDEREEIEGDEDEQTPENEE